MRVDYRLNGTYRKVKLPFALWPDPALSTIEAFRQAEVDAAARLAGARLHAGTSWESSVLESAALASERRAWSAGRSAALRAPRRLTDSERCRWIVASSGKRCRCRRYGGRPWCKRHRNLMRRQRYARGGPVVERHRAMVLARYRRRKGGVA